MTGIAGAGIALDYTHRIAPSALNGAGAVAVNRYVSWPANSWKTITKGEYDELVKAGFYVSLNWEDKSDDWTRGRVGGISHATAAVGSARLLGYQTGRVIIGSADFDMARSTYLAAGRAYAQAFAKVCQDAGYRPAVYGPWDVLQWVHDDGIMDAFWQAGMSTAWSGGRNSRAWPGAHLRQRGHKTVGGVDTDWSDILIHPLWGMVGNDMQLKIAAVGAKPDTAWYVGDGVWFRPIQTWPEHEALIADGAVERTFAQGDDWQAYTGRVAATTAGVTVSITQDEINAGIAANVDAIGQALASHIKIE